MRKTLTVVLAAILAGYSLYWYFTADSEPQFELDEGFTLLYDGESLAGWSVIGGQATFESSGEEIIGTHGPGDNTFLRTDRTFGDFTLKLQMRWEELGNSGVLFRAQQRPENGRAYGYQFELDSSERAWSGGVYDEARRGWIANLESQPDVRKAINLTDWNDIVVVARGANIQTWINGVLAADIVDGLDFDGFIALQVHAGDVGIMRWRHIQIMEHEPRGHPGATMATETDWASEYITSLELGENRFSGTFSEGVARMTARRQLDDALVRLTVQSCEEPTTIRMRHSPGDGQGPSYVQLKVFADRALVNSVTTDGETEHETVELNKAERHELTLVTVGNRATFTVGERDIARLDGLTLESRGQFIIEPARCGEQFEISDFSWIDLKEKNKEVLFYQTLDNEPAPVLTPEQAIESFRVAPGFEVELVAAEPLVEDPVAMAWDEYGRLYVVELRGYMPDAYGTGRNDPVGQVVRLEDLDGDGRMDKSEVFLGELVNPRAVAVVNEGILIGEPPNLWLCKQASPQAICSDKKRVGDYAPNVVGASVEHLENGLRLGLDNWLHNSKSKRKHRMVNGELQVEENLPRGQWGITRDNYGRLLYNHNSTWVQADLFPAEDIVTPGGGDIVAGLGANLTELSEVFSVRVNPGVNRAYLPGTLREDGRLHKATGASGLVAYRGDQFPVGYRNDVFVPEVAGNVVAQISLAEEGMELIAEHQLYDDETWGKREFLGSTDERFRPVDAMNGPDGALYVIDMYRGIAQDQHFLTDELREQIFQRQLDKPLGHGRIWRVRHTSGSADRVGPTLAEASDTQLVTYLSHPNGWVRDTAQRMLLASNSQIESALVAVAKGDDTLSAIHALWTLQGRDELTRSTALELLAIDDPQRQYQALRAGRANLQAKDMLSLAENLRDDSERLQMQLAFTLGDHAQLPEVRDALLEILLGQSKSDYVRQAVVRAVHGVEFEFLSQALADDGLNEQSEITQELLATLAANAYRTLRGDLTSDDAANPVLNALLSLVESRRGELDWQQIAMLDGFRNLTLTSSFTPAALESVPDIFADSSIGENNPLWPARLAGRAAFTWPGDELALGVTPLSPEQMALMAKGKQFYGQCGACHGSNGAGIAGLAPMLANSPWVLGPPEWLGRIILQGMNGPVEIDGEIWDGLMPPHGHMAHLDDSNLAGLMTYLRRAWGNKADPVSKELVASIREASAARSKSWTVSELEAVPFDRGYNRFLGKYSVSFLTVTISEQPEGLFMKVPMYGEGLMTPLSETLFEASAGAEKVRVEFLVGEDGSVGEFIMHRGAEKIPVKRIED
ncbi:MAG: family 16 glycoside hydrolase [Halioglobus sp.]